MRHLIYLTIPFKKTIKKRYPIYIKDSKVKLNYFVKK